MSNSDKGEEELIKPDQPVKILKNPPLPNAGYGLLFRQDLAQQISEFVSSSFYKRLKKTYALQAKDRAARIALNGANNMEWLSYYKGIAASTDLFFKDMEAAKEEYIKADSDETTKKFKK